MYYKRLFIVYYVFLKLTDILLEFSTECGVHCNIGFAIYNICQLRLYELTNLSKE